MRKTHGETGCVNAPLMTFLPQLNTSHEEESLLDLSELSWVKCGCESVARR